MFKKALRRSAILLALTLVVAPASKMHADCNVVTGCDPVPPPGGDSSSISITSLILYVMALT